MWFYKVHRDGVAASEIAISVASGTESVVCNPAHRNISLQRAKFCLAHKNLWLNAYISAKATMTISPTLKTEGARRYSEVIGNWYTMASSPPAFASYKGLSFSCLSKVTGTLKHIFLQRDCLVDPYLTPFLQKPFRRPSWLQRPTILLAVRTWNWRRTSN
jgi:hypothetical protein